jgi:hypothetical protein
MFFGFGRTKEAPINTVSDKEIDQAKNSPAELSLAAKRDREAEAEVSKQQLRAEMLDILNARGEFAPNQLRQEEVMNQILAKRWEAAKTSPASEDMRILTKIENEEAGGSEVNNLELLEGNQLLAVDEVIDSRQQPIDHGTDDTLNH